MTKDSLVAGVPAQPDRAWDVAVSAGIGIAVGGGPVLLYSFGVLVVPMAKTFGVSVALVAAIPGAAMILSAVLSPVAGWLVDRFGPRWVMLIGTLIYAGVLGLAATAQDIRSVQIAYIVALAGSSGVGAGVWYSLVAQRFGANRGLALGVTAAIGGFGVAANPVLASLIAANLGWRAAVIVLSVLVLMIEIPAIVWALRGQRLAVQRSNAPRDLVEVRGDLFSLRMAKIGGLILFGNVALGALIIHLPALLSARGLSAGAVSVVVGTLGVSSMVARLGFGTLIDRIYAPWVTAFAFSLPAIAAVLLAFGPSSMTTALVVAVLTGATLGSEGSDAPYLVSSAFHPRSTATLLGVVIGLLAVGMGLGPIILSQSLTWTQDYQFGILVVAGCSLMSSLIALSLRWRDLTFYPRNDRRRLLPRGASQIDEASI